MNGRKGPARFFPSFTEKYHHEPYEFISPTRPELSAAGKNVIVTGGGSGIGKAIAIAFAQAGARSVAILGRRGDVLCSAKAEIEAVVQKSGGRTLALSAVADLTSQGETLAAVRSIAEQVGPTDIFISNAGTCPAPKAITELDASELMSSLELNCITSLHALQAFSAVARSSMDASTGSKAVLIHVSSIAATATPINPSARPAPGPSPGPGTRPGSLCAYAVAKAASLKMFLHFAAEYPEFHIVSVHPGQVWSEMTDGIFPREACPDEADLAGQFCVWLASPEASFLGRKFVWANWDAEELVDRQDKIRDSKLLTWVVEGSAL